MYLGNNTFNVWSHMVHHCFISDLDLVMVYVRMLEHPCQSSLGSISRTHMVKGDSTPASCSDCHTHTMACMHPYAYTYTHKIYKITFFKVLFFKKIIAKCPPESRITPVKTH